MLTFSEDRYAAAGYVPAAVEASQVVGLFLMSDGSFRMADKLGNQFHFDPGGRMTELALSPAPGDRMGIEYLDRFTAAFVQPPYAARPADDRQMDFLNLRIPRRIEVRDRVHDHVEVLAFDPDGELPGYVPADATSSRFRVVALLSNGGLQIVDRHGNQIRLDRGWDFDSILPPRERQLVRSVTMGGHRVDFNYTLDGQGHVVIATAAVAEDKPQTGSVWGVRYEYDDQGRLCRVRPPAASSSPVSSLTEKGNGWWHLGRLSGSM
jgi:hypothetical protein